MSKVLPSEWDQPEHLSLGDRSFLVDRAETINGIVAKGYLQVGQVLLQVKRKFKSDPNLKGWFKRWCEECLPFSYATSAQFMKIAETVEDDPTLLDLMDTTKYSILYRTLCLPGKAREQTLELLKNGESFRTSDIESIKHSPEVILEAAQEWVDDLQMKVIQYEIEQASNSSSSRHTAQNKSQAKKRLTKALTQLQVAQDKVDGLEKSRTTQDVVVQQLQKQLNQKEVQLENMSLDPEQKRKRALAQTVVDATKGLDLLLGSLDRYGTDKPELGVEAIRTIERKMEEVTRKLCREYAEST